MDWIGASGDRYISTNTDGTFTVRIKKSYLGESFSWGVHTATGSGFHDLGYGFSDLPASMDWEDPSNFECADLMEEIPSRGGIYTIKAGETVDFVMSSKTVGYMVGEKCTVTVVVEPVK